MKRFIFGLLFLGAEALFPQLALAASADDLATEGVRLRRNGQDEKALPLFQEALRQHPTPRAFAQLGVCEQALGLWVAAESHILEALKQTQDSWILKNEEALRQSLAFVEARLGAIALWGSPAGARIRVDGEPVATLPTGKPVRAVAGRRVLTIEAPGFLSETRAVDIRVGALAREHVVLVTSGPTVPVSQREISATHSPFPSPTTNSQVAPSDDDRTWKSWIAAGLSAGGIGLLTWGIVWIAIDGNPSPCGIAPNGGQCPVYDTRVGGWILVGTGVAAAVGGGFLLYADRKRHHIAFGLRPTGATLIGKF